MLEVCEVEKVQPLITLLFRRIVRCIGGTHLQVADRAMCFFENDYFLTILKTYKDLTFPMLVPVIVDLAENHWHKILQESLVALKTILKEIDQFTFQESLELKGDDKKNNPYHAIKQQDTVRRELDQKWDKIDRSIKDANPGYAAPLIPFKSSGLICDFNELYKKIYDKEKYVNL